VTGVSAGHTATVCFALALLVTAAYGRSLSNGFVFDDAIFVERDVRIQAPVQWRLLLTKPLWLTESDKSAAAANQHYRPLQLAPLAVSSQWFGGSALPCHLLNLTLHFLNSLLVYGLLRRVFLGPNAALLMAALFAAHPALSESVLWVSDVAGLGATFCMLALTYVHARKHGSFVGATLVAVLYLGAMGFKETGILAPLMLLAFDVTARRGTNENARAIPWVDYGFLLPALSVYLTLRYNALGTLVPANLGSGMSVPELAINGLALLPKYASTYLRSFDPSLYHDFTPATGFDDPRVQTGAMLLVATALVFLGTVRERPMTAFGILWAAIAAAPYLLVRWPWLDVFSERYAYLPAAGVALACGGLVQLTAEPGRIERFSRVLLGLTAALLVPLFVWIDYGRTGEWQSETTIRHATRPEGAETASQKNIRLQLEMLTKNPNFPKAWQNLGDLYMSADRPRDAISAFREADRRNPNQAATLLHLGYAYDLSGQRELAIETYFRMLEHHPRTIDVRHNLAVIAYESGQTNNARAMIAELLRLAPKDPAAREMKTKLDAIGHTPVVTPPQSSATYRRCREANEAAAAGRLSEAIAKLRTASWLDEKSSLPHHYLANVYYRAGRIDDAISHQKRAVALAPENEIYRTNLAALERVVAGGANGIALDSRVAVGN
jgi:tetratricopeptide (TPR) repeat protein